MRCAQGYEIKPLKSAAGWYLGTIDSEGLPNCRISTQYAPTEEEAKLLFMDRQMAAENEFCNGGCGCVVRYCDGLTQDEVRACSQYVRALYKLWGLEEEGAN